MSIRQPIRQLAYVVEDVREAAQRHHRLFGSGPFFVLDRMELSVEYRGRHGVPFTSTWMPPR